MEIYECKYCDYTTKTMQLMINHNLYKHMPVAKKKTVTGIKRIKKGDPEWSDMDIPHLRGGDWKWNFEKKTVPLTDKITWVLTAVNVAIFVYSVIKNV